MGLGRRFKIRGGAFAFEPEYQAVLDRATALSYNLPDSATNIRNNNRVKFLKQIGSWTNFDLFYIFDNPSGLANFSKINYINPSTNELFNANPALEPDFIANSGFKSDGTKWFNTLYNTRTDMVNVVCSTSTLSKVSIIFKGFDWSSNSIQEGFFGNFESGSSQLQFVKLNNNTTLLVRPFVNSGGNEPLTPTELNKHCLLSIQGVTGLGTGSSLYLDGSFDQLIQNASGGTAVNRPCYLFAVNSAGTAISIARSGMKYFGIGGYFGGTNPNQNAIDIYNIMNDTF
jgi:hypothetical protein